MTIPHPAPNLSVKIPVFCSSRLSLATLQSHEALGDANVHYALIWGKFLISLKSLFTCLKTKNNITSLFSLYWRLYKMKNMHCLDHAKYSVKVSY